MSVACNICGNPVANDTFICPYCKSYDLSVDAKNVLVRRVDIGHGGQSVNQARTKLNKEVAISRRRGDNFLVIIHGHGSTGAGGDIRKMIRAQAHQMQRASQIAAFISGENLEEGNAATRSLLSQTPSIRELKEWQKGNQGITVLILSQ